MIEIKKSDVGKRPIAIKLSCLNCGAHAIRSISDETKDGFLDIGQTQCVACWSLADGELVFEGQ